MTTHGLLIEPLDVLFFRSSRPEDPMSVLPQPQTLAGALRTALLHAHGVSTDLSGAGSRPIRELLAERGAPAAVIDARFAGPFLTRRPAGEWDVLFPAPRSLFRAADSIVRAWPATGRSAGERLVRATVRDGRGLAPVWLDPRHGDAEQLQGFLTRRGMQRFLAGGTPALDDLVEPAALFEHDPRVGVGIDADASVADEGILYVTSFLALAPRVGFYGEIEAAPDVVRRLDGLPIKLGGEGRRSLVRVVPPIGGGRQAWSAKPGAERSVLVSITAGAFGGPIPAVLEGKARAATVGKPICVSGWDAARGFPLPSRQLAPAGSVWFIEGGPPSVDSLSASEEESARGEGLFLTGVWQ